MTNQLISYLKTHPSFLRKHCEEFQDSGPSHHTPMVWQTLVS